MTVALLRLLVWLLGGVCRPFRGRRRSSDDPVRCLLVGYGGAANTGAEARTAEAIRQMLACDDRIAITLTSLDRRATLRYLDESERLSIAQVSPVFLGSILKLVLAADIVVLVEGSCFKENFSSALLWFFLSAAGLAQRLGIPTVAWGVDAGPLSMANRGWARAVARRMDLLMLRTQSAAQTLRGIGVFRPMPVTADTAFTLVPEEPAWAETVLMGQGVDLAKPVVAIAFEEFFWWPVVARPFAALIGRREDRYRSIYYHAWGREGRARSRAMRQAIAAYADGIAGELGAQIVLVAMERLDIGPCRDVQAAMRSRAVLIDADHANARQIAAILGRCSWIVTCRYHALVLAMLSGVPAIGLAHDERIAAILDELGLLEDAFIPWDEPRILAELQAKTAAVRARLPEMRRVIERALPVYLERMADNARYFRTLLGERFPRRGES